MKSINQVILLGNLTRDPELRYTPNGNAVIGFSIATNRQWVEKNSGEKKEATEFHDIVFWGKAAEIISQYVVKGSKILVQGRLQTRSWEGQDGIKRYKTEIVGNDFVLFDKKGEKTEIVDDSEPQTEKVEAETKEEIVSDDLPF
jgi:single-strand DNA-binding protein